MYRCIFAVVISAVVIFQPSPASATAWCGDPGRVLIILDHSGSMSSYSKWTNAKSAVNSLTAKFAGQIYFGLMLFPGSGGSCNPGQIDVPVGPNTKNLISSAMSKASPTGMTPIGSSMKNAYNYLKGFQSKLQRYALLITDGSETCSGKAIDWVKALAGLGIKTFVVGFGSGVNPSELNTLAMAGGTPLSGSTKYYKADSPSTLTTALQTIGNLVSCCGNGKLDAGEKCEKTIPYGKPGSCPKSSKDCPQKVCFIGAPTGTECQVTCGFTPVTKPSGTTKDGCCPPGANFNTDKDCKAACGNGVLEAGEKCDPGIKSGAGKCLTLADCDDKDKCTKDELVGSACHVACQNTAIKSSLTAKDGCCPKGLTSVDDLDCLPPCGPDKTKNCVNPCLNVKCPPGYYCFFGKCKPLENSDGGGKAGSDGGGTVPPGQEAGTGTGNDGGGNGNNGNGNGFEDGFVTGQGCACQVNSSQQFLGLLFPLALVLSLLLVKRRKR